MVEESKESTDALDDGTEGSSIGYRSFGAEKESTPAGKVEGKEDKPEAEEKSKEEEEESEEESEEEEEEEEPGAEKEDEFTLPKGSKELEQERKGMQRLVTGKLKEVANVRLKANLVDAIEKDPKATLEALAERFGVDLGKGKAAAKEEKFELPTVDIVPEKDESMPAYMQRLMKATFASVPEMIKTAIGEATESKTTGKIGLDLESKEIDNALHFLDKHHPDWGIYEKRMVELIAKYPNMKRDPTELYKIAKATSVNISDKSKTSKKKATRTGARSKSSVKVTSRKGKIMDFTEAWNTAKADLRKA